MPIMDLDLIVATPCNNLAIMPMGMDTVDVLQKNPSRFEMTSREQKLWDRLRHVHRENFKPGTPLRQINKVFFLNIMEYIYYKYYLYCSISHIQKQTNLILSWFLIYAKINQIEYLPPI
jgi:hypothetical protein